MNFKKVLFFISFLCFSLIIKAQQIDSTQVASKKQNKEKNTILKKDNNHSPTKATLYSAVIPGLGQAYNRKYWKLPIIYGLGGYLIYNISVSNSNYKTYLEAINHRQELDAINLAEESDLVDSDQYVNIYSDTQLQTRKDFYKKKRDMNIVYALLLYTANILDAAVDAHLMDFEVGEKYIMSLEPTFLPTASVSNSIGLSLSVKFQ